MNPDFRAIKERFTLIQVAKSIGLKLTPENGQYRCPCPRCGGDDRAIVITPSKNLFFCFQSKKGGDLISLVAHVHDLSFRQAAQFILDGEEPVIDDTDHGTHKGLEPLNHLNYTHEAVRNLGIPEIVAERIGIGYAHKGVMRNHVAVPIRTEDGTLVGYIGIQKAKMPPSWRIT